VARKNSRLGGSYKVALGLLSVPADYETNGDIMRTKLMGLAKKAAGLLMIELLVPGGTLIVLAFLLTGGSLPIPEKLAAALPILGLLKRS